MFLARVISADQACCGRQFWLKHTFRTAVRHLAVNSNRSRQFLVDISCHFKIARVSWFGLAHVELCVLVPHPALGNQPLHEVLHKLFHLVDQKPVAVVVHMGQAEPRLNQLNFAHELGRLEEGALLLDCVALPTLEELVIWVGIVTTVLIIRDLFATLFLLNFVGLFHRHTVVLVVELVPLL